MPTADGPPPRPAVPSTARPAVFTIAPHVAFVDALAQGLLDRAGGDRLALARTRVLLPNRRAVRALTDAFVRRSDGGLLLPRMTPIGDIADDGLADDAATLDLAAPVRTLKGPLAYHSACSMQHGQKITDLPKRLLGQAGFTVRDVPEGHICCGSAGTYNLLQPEIAGRLRERKLGNIERTEADLIAAGNIGCLTQLAGDRMPVVHTVELLDWMAGGPAPPAVAALPRAA